MSWYIRYPLWLRSELKELKSNSNYIEVATNLDRSLVSSGYIVTRLATANRYPVLFVYPDATPYLLPHVFLLGKALDRDEVIVLSKLSPDEITSKIQSCVKFYPNARHQNPTGALCILEAEDVLDERPDFAAARAVISRVRDWFVGVQTGRFPQDSREIELFLHFPNKTYDIQFLLPDEFFNTEIIKGQFFFGQSVFLPQESDRTFYFGLGILGQTQGGIEQFSIYEPEDNLIFAQGVLDPIKAVKLGGESIEKFVKEGQLIEGQWWDIQKEPQPFESVTELASLIGDGDVDRGISIIVEACRDTLTAGRKHIYVGLRFPARRLDQARDWQIVRLVGAQDVCTFLFEPVREDELKERLVKRTVEALHSEYVTDTYFHLRNRGRCDRNQLSQRSVTCIGVGALGSSIASLVAKAGVSQIHLVDKDRLYAHNVVRHTGGLNHIGQAKVDVVALDIGVHNPFVRVFRKGQDITSCPLESYFPSDSVGICTIADDNIEAFFNEQAVRENRTVFYARGLRGGKAARIFRVKPGVDACKECLALYYKENKPPFVAIAEDESLPVLTNECNNPVRPGSGSDLGIISSITARIVLEYLQGSCSDVNHWIWTTEPLEGFDYNSKIPYALHAQSIKPHPKCRLCQRLKPQDVLITPDAYDLMKKEASESGEVETGGILMGFRSEEGNIVVTRASGPGPNARKRNNWFERDSDYCQRVLERTVAEIGDRGQYVGEWHYHPTGTNQPSGRDLQSLTEIALQANYATDEPILIILSPVLEFACTIHPADKGYVNTALKTILTDEAMEMKLASNITA